MGEERTEEEEIDVQRNQLKSEEWEIFRQEAERLLRITKKQREEKGETISEEDRWRLRNYERIGRNEEEEATLEREKRRNPAIKGGLWHQNVLLNE